MAEFVFKNSYFEFDSSVIGTAIGTRFALPYSCIFMDQNKNKFLETHILNPLVRFRYIHDIFFVLSHGEEKF